MDQYYWSRLYYSHFADNEMEYQIHYINLASNKSGFESRLCHFLTLYPWANSVLFPLHPNISIFLSKSQPAAMELLFRGPSTSITWSLLWTVQHGDRSALSSLQIYCCHIRIHTVVPTWLVPREFRAYSAYAKLKLIS